MRGDNIVVSDNEISNNTADGTNVTIHGGGIYTSGANVTISGNTINNNVIQGSSNRGYGGGIYVHGAAAVEGNIISNNRELYNWVGCMYTPSGANVSAFLYSMPHDNTVGLP